MYNIVGYAKTWNNRESTFWVYIDLYIYKKWEIEWGKNREEKKVKNIKLNNLMFIIVIVFQYQKGLWF